jgi:hypothetical protein
LRWAGNFYPGVQFSIFLKTADFHRQRGIWRETTGVEPGVGFIPERMQRLRLAEMILFPL